MSIAIKMSKPKKRLSAGMGYNADGIDPLFEFDVPRNFVDLTLPPKYFRVADIAVGAYELHSAAITSCTPWLLAHDPWFDHVHEDHSRPTNEDDADSKRKSMDHHSANISRHHALAATKQGHPDGEKENLGAPGTARLKRRNVAYTTTAKELTPKTASATASTKTTVRATKKTPTATKLPFGTSASSGTTKPTNANSSTPSKHSDRTLPRKRLSRNEPTPTSGGSATTKPRTKVTVGANAGKDLHDLQALLAKHNKKFKPTHTYEPRQHSVRDVRQWERQTLKSYYKLSSEDRAQANAEIAKQVQDRVAASSR